jgi:ubiquinone/menaquinone biosynthesis C-methylase UbiE
MTEATHQDLILDQFTRQATVFSTAPPITDDDALKMIVDAARPAPDDRLLDVACGPGLVV